MINKTNCPLCPANNLLKGPIIAQTAAAYLIATISNPHTFLIIPTAHTEAVTDLPDTWWLEVKTLIKHIPDLPKQYNISINIGEQAGQTIKHLHFWVIPRLANQPATGKGLARLIFEANNSTNRH
jgi:diadenosine tetraphosphate (Ap4A) HIT family hydrolase